MPIMATLTPLTMPGISGVPFIPASRVIQMTNSLLLGS